MVSYCNNTVETYELILWVLMTLGSCTIPKPRNNLLTAKHMTRAGADLGFFKGGEGNSCKGGVDYSLSDHQNM